MEVRSGGGPDRPAERDESAAQLGGSPKRTLYRGWNPERAAGIEDLRAMAHRRLPRFALEYLEAGAGDETALAGNLAAFRRWRLLPRALVDVSQRDLGRDLFGRGLPFPLIVAPTGLNGIFWSRADVRLATAASKAGVPFVQSTMSNDRIEDVGDAGPGLRHWFQLYVTDPPDISDGLIDRAESAGCEALVITTDAQIFGKRSWSERERTGPSELRWGAIFDAALHPRWIATTLLPNGMPAFENVLPWVPEDRSGFYQSAFWIRDRLDRGLDWDKVERIRDRWKKPLLIKGLLHPADVERSVQVGADGVVLSNHGARQIASSAAPLDMLPAAREVSGGRIPVLVDGGVRSGGDIAKALALGADAVLSGRAILYGLAAAGESGAGRALQILRDEFDLTLGLLGCPAAADLNRDFLRLEGVQPPPGESRA